MKSLITFLFPTAKGDTAYSLLLLVLRFVFGGLIMLHGLEKITAYEFMKFTFPDPIGWGSQTSLILIICAEVFCAAFIIAGLLTRPMCIPLIFSMTMAAFVVHAGQSFNMKELAIIYLIAFTILLISGPGKYSFDQVIGLIMNRTTETH
ncbi:MAG: DoxX family protein [Bacteroidales bacterium]|nr:DoxX family protein [Bacteroidales bacterium]